MRRWLWLAPILLLSLFLTGFFVANPTPSVPVANSVNSDSVADESLGSADIGPLSNIDFLASTDAVSAVGQLRLRFNGSTLQQSISGAAYSPIGTGVGLPAGQVPFSDGIGLIGSAGLTFSAGRLRFTQPTSIELGFGVTGKEGNAGRIGYNLFGTDLDIVGSGTASPDRKIKLWDDVMINDALTVTGTTRLIALPSAGSLATNADGEIIPGPPAITGMADGTAAAPGWSFINDTDTGLFRTNADELRIAAGGALSFSAGMREWIFGRNDGLANNLRILNNRADDGYEYIQVGASATDTAARLRISRFFSTLPIAELRVESNSTVFSGSLSVPALPNANLIRTDAGGTLTAVPIPLTFGQGGTGATGFITNALVFSAGSALSSHLQVLIDPAVGGVIIRALTMSDGADVPVSPAGQGRLRYNPTTASVEISEGGGPYVRVLGGTTVDNGLGSGNALVDRTTVPNETILLYTTVGTSSLTVPNGVTSVRVLVVGGGGGGNGGVGGINFGNAGGGGQVIDTTVAVTPGATITVTVGPGGGGTITAHSAGGASSSFGTTVAQGGLGSPNTGTTGGVSGNGNIGGTGVGDFAGGGGGGAGGPGSGINGGPGVNSDITGIVTGYGGGGGSRTATLVGTVSHGGAASSIGGPYASGAANRGGGGSGGDSATVGGSGGSGIVVVRWTTIRTMAVPSFLRATFGADFPLVSAGADVDLLPTTVANSRGGAISMSGGVFTLAAGRTYELFAWVTVQDGAATAHSTRFRWVDTANVQLPGSTVGSSITAGYSTFSLTPSADGPATAIIAPVAPTTVKLRTFGATSVGFGESLSSYVFIREI